MTSRLIERERGDRAGRVADDPRPAMSDDQIVERIFAAVMERRLRPGAKLSKARFARLLALAARASVRFWSNSASAAW